MSYLEQIRKAYNSCHYNKLFSQCQLLEVLLLQGVDDIVALQPGAGMEHGCKDNYEDADHANQ